MELDSLNSILYDPTKLNDIAKNQRFIVDFPGEIQTLEIRKHNVFIMDQNSKEKIYCNVGIDEDDDNQRLYIYPSKLLIQEHKITLYINEISILIDGKVSLSENRYWYCTVQNRLAPYPDDPLADLYEDTSNSTTTITDLILVRTLPAYGNPFTDPDDTIILEFNKALDSTMDMATFIKVEKHHVLF